MRQLFFLALAFSVLLLLHDARQYYTSESLNQSKTEESASYYLNDFTLKAFHQDGTLQYQVQGQHLKHWQTNRRSHIFMPSLESYDQNGQTEASLKAQEAWLEHASKNLELKGDVQMQDQLSTLHTESLLANLTDKSITSDQLVTIRSADNTLQGVGMDSKLDEKRLRLHKHVKTTYQTTP